MSTKYAIGIDVGGTTTKFGLVSADGEIICQDRIPSNEHEHPDEPQPPPLPNIKTKKEVGNTYFIT
jgi:sugar (pentulose or hexulose) kinase